MRPKRSGSTPRFESAAASAQRKSRNPQKPSNPKPKKQPKTQKAHLKVATFHHVKVAT
jgi:hypothetical protein